jgi:hypothetical protein
MYSSLHESFGKKENKHSFTLVSGRGKSLSYTVATLPQERSLQYIWIGGSKRKTPAPAENWTLIIQYMAIHSPDGALKCYLQML